MGPSVPDAIPTSFTLTLKAMGSKEDDSFFKQCISDLSKPAPMAIYSWLGFYKIIYLGLDFYCMHLKQSNYYKLALVLYYHIFSTITLIKV